MFSEQGHVSALYNRTIEAVRMNQEQPSFFIVFVSLFSTTHKNNSQAEIQESLRVNFCDDWKRDFTLILLSISDSHTSETSIVCNYSGVITVFYSFDSSEYFDVNNTHKQSRRVKVLTQ